jgi:molybdopterin converting factor small subunit
MNEPKKLTVKYFAVLREKTGKSQEEIETLANSALELYVGLANKYNFPLESSSIRVSINEEFRNMNDILHSGDSIIFIPPVAGG